MSQYLQLDDIIVPTFYVFCVFSFSFLTAHIWACPPSEGDDYIFHCHPEEQKIPKPKRLTEWYRKMLDTGKSPEYKVICDYRVSAFLVCSVSPHSLNIFVLMSFLSD